MNDSTTLHPSELAYIFTYMKVGSVIGWGSELFAAPGDPDAWADEGLQRLQASGRLVPGKQPGRYRFHEDFLDVATALSDPQVVLLAQRKEGDGVRTLTHHIRDTEAIGLSLLPEGHFDLTPQPSFAAAAGAAAAFAGASPRPVDERVRIEANHKVLQRLDGMAEAGEIEPVIAALQKLGASEAEAKSAVLAFARPAASGVVSMLYCNANNVQDAEAYTVLTNEAAHSWLVFPPADADGPVVLERSSIASLTSRLVITIAARVKMPV